MRTRVHTGAAANAGNRTGENGVQVLRDRLVAYAGIDGRQRVLQNAGERIARRQADLIVGHSARIGAGSFIEAAVLHRAAHYDGVLPLDPGQVVAELVYRVVTNVRRPIGSRDGGVDGRRTRHPAQAARHADHAVSIGRVFRGTGAVIEIFAV